jgi:hypothetical protein
MPVESQSYTLSEIAGRSNDPILKKVVNVLHEGNNIMTDIPLRTNAALKMRWSRYDHTSSLPTINWAKINEEPAATRGKPSFYSTEMALIRNLFSIDRRLAAQPDTIGNPIDDDFEIWKQVLQYEFNRRFIYNDPATGEEDAPAGINTILANPSVYGMISDTKINVNLDISLANVTAAAARALMVHLQRIIARCTGGKRLKGIFYCNQDTLVLVANAARVLGTGAGFDITRDSYDRPFTTFMGYPFKDIGYDVSQTNYIITNTEPATGTGNTGGTATSVYFVTYGDQAVTGWQPEDLTIEPLGRSERGTHNLYLIDWGVGWAFKGPRCIGQLHNLTLGSLP